MTTRHYLLTTALMLVAAIAGAGISTTFLSAPSAQARADERIAEDARSDKWEYCAITKAQYLNSNRGNQYWIAYFRSGRVQTVDVEGGLTSSAISNAIFKLGEEGWEMVGEGGLEVRKPDDRALYFKRRKSS